MFIGILMNLFVVLLLEKVGFELIGVFEFFGFGVIFFVIGGFYMMFVLMCFLLLCSDIFSLMCKYCFSLFFIEVIVLVDL